MTFFQWLSVCTQCDVNSVDDALQTWCEYLHGIFPTITVKEKANRKMWVFSSLTSSHPSLSLYLYLSPSLVSLSLVHSVESIYFCRFECTVEHPVFPFKARAHAESNSLSRSYASVVFCIQLAHLKMFRWPAGTTIRNVCFHV